MTFLKNIALHKSNIKGWRTKRKIVVIESDDWGSIRTPSREIYDSIIEAGLPLDKCHYSRYDALESEKDLDDLFNVLVGYRDRNGKHPVITANTVVANPDFNRIKESDFNEYSYELFPETYKRYPAHSKSFDIYKKGVSDNLFFPQFHGREHLNVLLWMKMLRQNSHETRLTFDYNFFGIGTTITAEKRKSYLASLDINYLAELDWQKLMLSDGLDRFEELFGFRSGSFIATNYIWHSNLEPLLSEKGIRFLQGIGLQFQPTDGEYIKKKHTLGETNECDQIYLLRNCIFEPSFDLQKDWINSVLNEISVAFTWHKPATICTHRLNYIGFIDASNRSRGLKSLDSLLKEICRKWPDVEFMSTVQLGNLISKDIYNNV